ncbi:MAG: DNA-binding protein, partial [Candidatus Bathyarchaeota archaeon]|nr:DNA-binding protein [Candidatus Bathyarchaeota archaeon]
MSGDEELEEIRRRRLQELQKQLAQEQQEVEIEQRLDAQKQSMLRRILTSEARQRLTNLKIARPQFASQIELQLIQIAQQGRINLPITDEQLKEI